MIEVLIATNLITIALLVAAYVAGERRLEYAEERADARLRERDEREENLLQRIQAPQAAIAQHTVEQAGPLQPISLSDDDDIVAWQDKMKQEVASLEASTAAVIENYDVSAAS